MSTNDIVHINKLELKIRKIEKEIHDIQLILKKYDIFPLSAEKLLLIQVESIKDYCGTFTRDELISQLHSHQSILFLLRKEEKKRNNQF